MSKYNTDNNYMTGLAAIVIGIIGLFFVSGFFNSNPVYQGSYAASTLKEQNNCRVFKNNCGGCINYGCQFCVKNGKVYQNSSSLCLGINASLPGSYTCYTDQASCPLK